VRNPGWFAKQYPAPVIPNGSEQYLLLSAKFFEQGLAELNDVWGKKKEAP